MPGRIRATSAAPPAIADRDAARQATLAATLDALYPKPVSIVLELGCGHGHFLAAYATQRPDIQCLGVDLVSHRINLAQRKQKRLKINNLAFFKAEAAETLAALPTQARLGGIFVLFPDPWPKTRHHRRRLLQTDLLDALADRANPGAWLALRTDDAGFLIWAHGQIERHPAWRITPETPWPFEHPTYFQEIKGPHQSLMATQCGKVP